MFLDMFKSFLFTACLLASRSVASPVEYYIKSLSEREIPLSAEDLTNFRFYVQYAASAYCNSDNDAGEAIICSENDCPEVEENRATVLASFNGPATGIAGFVGVDPVQKLIIVSIRGSNNIRNWIANALFAYDSCDGLGVKDCQVHTGFQAAYNEVSAPLLSAVSSARAAHPSHKLVVTGHSLGGAVATFAAAHLRRAGHACDVYTFGSPRVGNAAFTDFVSRQQAGSEFRVTHLDDPVPRLPPIIFGYRHTTPEYWLHGGDGTSVDYGLGDVRICEGDANLMCNAGTLGLDIDAHLHYLRRVAACGAQGLPWKVRRGAEISDAELEEMVNGWVKADKEAVESGNV